MKTICDEVSVWILLHDSLCNDLPIYKITKMLTCDPCEIPYVNIIQLKITLEHYLMDSLMMISLMLSWPFKIWVVTMTFFYLSLAQKVVHEFWNLVCSESQYLWSLFIQLCIYAHVLTQICILQSGSPNKCRHCHNSYFVPY